MMTNVPSLIAVGTPITARPKHRTVRADFPQARVPPSGSWKVRGHATSDDVPESYPACRCA
jgi:hypothetical protein